MLLLARTLTSTAWLLDFVAPLLRDDHRLQVHFARPEPWSAFDAGLEQLLEDQQVLEVSWDVATSRRYDLAVAATPNGDLDRVDAPLLIVPHGVGYTKHTSLPPRAPGIQRSAVEDSSRTVIAVSHPSQTSHVASLATREISVVSVGDPCWEALQAVWEERDEHRAMIGVGERTLVTLTSTWGPQSLFGTKPSLAADLLRTLASDEFAVGLILHPNTWAAHSPWQIRQWLDGAIRSGLVLAPPFRSWRNLLVSSDVVIGDHGSVTFYAAALGIPTALGTFATDEVVRGSVMDELRDHASRFDGRATAELEVRRVQGAGPVQPPRELAEMAFEAGAVASEGMRSLIYEMLGLDPWPLLVALADQPGPALAAPRASAHSVHCTANSVGSAPSLHIKRFPLTTDPAIAETSSHPHVAVDWTDPRRRLRQSANLLYCYDNSVAGHDHDRWVSAVRRQHPGARAVATLTANGSRVSLPGVTWQVGPPSLAGLDEAVVASAIYHLDLHGSLPPSAQQIVVHCGNGEFELEVHRS